MGITGVLWSPGWLSRSIVAELPPLTSQASLWAFPGASAAVPPPSIEQSARAAPGKTLIRKGEWVSHSLPQEQPSKDRYRCVTPSWQQSPQKSLQRTLSDESLCSGRREPSFANPASLEPGLPSDVLFTSTCAFPSSTLPARRQHQHPLPPGSSGGSSSNSPSTIPATGNGFPEKKCEPGTLGLDSNGHPC